MEESRANPSSARTLGPCDPQPDESTHWFDLAIADWPEVAFDLPSNQPTELLNSWHHCSTTSETVATNPYPTFSFEDFTQNGTATPSDQNDHQFLRQSSVAGNPPLLLRSDQSTINEWFNVSIPGVIRAPNTVAVGDIDEYAQVGLQNSFARPTPNSDVTDTINLDQPGHQTSNGFDATLTTEAIPCEEQGTTLPLPLHPPQSSSSTNTNLSAPYRCATCSLRFEYWGGLYDHCRSTKHHEHACPILVCDFTCDRRDDILDHMRVTHSEFRACNQCKAAFNSIAALGKHASETGHASFSCPEEGCGKAFSRFDVFQRHQDTHRLDGTRYPCPHCRKYRGIDGFKRKDHLTQHLRNYHHIGVDELNNPWNIRVRSCPHGDCSEWRPVGTERKSHAFQKSSDYIAHMRKVHKESDFPCTERDCNRAGPKGYFRMRDLQKHKLKEHGIPIE